MFTFNCIVVFGSPILENFDAEQNGVFLQKKRKSNRDTYPASGEEMTKKLNHPRILWAVAVCLLFISACTSESSKGRDTSPEANGSVEGDDGETVKLDYLLLAEFTMSSDETVKEKATVLFRGPLTLDSDGTAAVRGEGSVEGDFRCANKDLHSDTEFLGPGSFEGEFTFNVKGSVLSEEEFNEATGEIPLVPLTADTEKLTWVKLYFPDGYAPPSLAMEGLDTGNCFSADRNPITPQWTVGLSGLLKGDGGEDFNQYVYIPLRPGAVRQIETLNPELVRAAFICLAEPGEVCDLDL